MRWFTTLLFALSLAACKGDSANDTGPNANVDEDGDGYAPPLDCDDTDSAIHPGQEEVCDGKDNDCDGTTDGEGASDAGVWYYDNDGDGYGDPDTEQVSCDPGDRFVQVGGDCDDTDGDFNPGASETDCTDPNDYNCDGSVGFGDADQDGYPACEECDDRDPEVNPGQIEVCDGKDNDCDGVTDPPDAQGTSTFFRDADGDGFGGTQTVTACEAPEGYVAESGDCDDNDATLNPDTAWYLDYDHDSYGDPDRLTRQCAQPSGYVRDDSDCDDSNSAVNPTTTWYYDYDSDSYGNPSVTLTQCDQPNGYVLPNTDCDDSDAAINPATVWYLDSDQDSYGDSSVHTTQCAQPSGYVLDNTDCDDADSSLNPATVWYRDSDNDQYGTPSSSQTRCAQPSGYVRNSADCDDNSGSVHPGAAEYCDTTDTDCDGDTYDSDSLDAITYYADTDGDGYGDASNTIGSCSVPTGYVTNTGDCADSDSSAYPGSHGFETSGDGIDTDCDGNDDCDDLNCDGYPDILMPAYYDGSGYIINSYMYYGSASGYSSSNRASLLGKGVWASVVMDIDEDGWLDILFSNYQDTTSSYSTDSYIYWGSAAGYSSSNRTDLPTVGATDVEVADLDNDGYNDIVFASYYTGSSYSTNAYLYWGSSSGYSTSDRTLLPVHGSRDVDVADLDGDGYYEIVLASYYNQSSTDSVSSYIYWGGSQGYSTTDRTTLSGYRHVDSEIADINADGRLDILLTSYYDGNYSTTSYVWYGSSGGFSTSNRSSLTTVGPWDAAVADLDNDGHMDIAFCSFASGSGTYTGSYNYVYYGASSGFSTSNRTTLTSSGCRQITAADLNDDGYEELITSNERSSSSNFEVNSNVWFGASSGFSTLNRDDLPTKGTYNHAVADLDGDGYLEVIFGNYRTNSSNYSPDSPIYWGASTGFSSTSVTSLPGYAIYAAPIVVGSVD